MVLVASRSLQMRLADRTGLALAGPVPRSFIGARDWRCQAIPGVEAIDVRDVHALNVDPPVLHGDLLPLVRMAERDAQPTRALLAPRPRARDVVGRGCARRNTLAVVLPVRAHRLSNLVLHPHLQALRGLELRQAGARRPEGGLHQKVCVRGPAPRCRRQGHGRARLRLMGGHHFRLCGGQGMHQIWADLHGHRYSGQKQRQQVVTGGASGH
eukprot:CAMPEP_0168357574 /NCGR_PEP_ID=MMETSP0228-20121227/662_1 /TAXON_ID=133427 /ORGANISM="Protoceratium reticulatum, Strain CCCM 535 (=CCMP 1889)" /LENGTH=211 /DNA_ID=CAMNT_0008370107 /DNA_START=586 /DNA_END=1218 /DNA_ORIENTATION=-